MIKAIVFDCFGVLATDGWLPFREKYFGSDTDVFEQATALNKRADAGLLDYDEFVRRVADKAGVTAADAHAQIEHNIADNEVLDFIGSELKPQYKIGLLSNAGVSWLDKIFTPAQLALFDATALSYELGVIKPDPIMYRTIAERLGVENDECIFIDDQLKYCDGARQVGMNTIQYTGLQPLKDELRPLLGN